MKKINYIVLFNCLALLFACNKQLNVQPTTSAVDGNVIIDSSSARNVLDGVYYLFANAGTDYNSVPTMKWMNVMELIPAELSGTMVPSFSSDENINYSFINSSPSVSTLWSYGYGIVNAANGFLKNIADINNISTNSKNAMIGEAKFLRAYANEMLLLTYGQYYDTTSKYGIILRDQFVDATSINKARSTVAQSYSSILADLDEAISTLPAQNRSQFYSNKTAAQILKSRVLINRGLKTDWENVVTLVNDMAQSSPFSLEANTKDIFLTKGVNSNEVVLALSPYTSPAQNWKFYYYQFNGSFSCNFNDTLLFKDDPRQSWYFKIDTGGSSLSSYYGAILQFTKYYSGSQMNPQITSLAEVCYAFRMTEPYLYKAEALANLNTNISESKSILKLIKGNAGFTNLSSIDNLSATDLKNQILIEELKSFMGENGTDWYALRRLPISISQTIQPFYKQDIKNIFPIPITEIQKNNLAIQNPGYL